MNLFATVLTHSAPSANYRGESAENRAVIQKINRGRFVYPVVSPEAMRNALRETFVAMGLPCNRTRLHDRDQLAVEFKDYPDADNYIDDFFMGWLVAAGRSDRNAIMEELRQKGRDPDRFSFKRDSVLRMNLAVGLEPYRFDSLFTQSPQDATAGDVKGHTNADNSQLLHREMVYTAYQYPLALNLEDCREKKDWTVALLKAIGQLNGVAGNHARSYFEMAPASIVVRMTPLLAAGYDTYGFQVTEEGAHAFPDIVEAILAEDFDGEEFFIGGKIVKDLAVETVDKLKDKKATLENNPLKLLETVGKKAFS